MAFTALCCRILTIATCSRQPSDAAPKVIVTSNLKDFPASLLEQFNIESRRRRLTCSSCMSSTSHRGWPLQLFSDKHRPYGDRP